MTGMKMPRVVRYLVLVLALLAVSAVGLYVSGSRWRLKMRSLPGSNTARVRLVLGKPSTVYRNPGEFEQTVRSLEADGWLRSDRYLPVRGEVWVYRSESKLRESCTFVYFDKRGRVDRAFRAWW